MDVLKGSLERRSEKEGELVCRVFKLPDSEQFLCLEGQCSGCLFYLLIFCSLSRGGGGSFGCWCRLSCKGILFLAGMLAGTYVFLPSGCVVEMSVWRDSF